MIKAVVFDVGGVLCEWIGICRQLSREAGINFNQFLAVFLKLSFNPKTGADLGYMTINEFMVKFAEELGVPEKAKDWRRKLLPGFKRIEPSYKLLDELKNKYRLAVLTNSKIGLWDEWQEGRLRDYFEIIVDSSEVHALKPDEKIYRILLERLGLTARECLFIDDDKKNIEAAEKLGFQTVHFTDPKKSVKLIRKKLYGTI